MNITIQCMFYYSYFLKLNSHASPIRSCKFKNIIPILRYADQTINNIRKQMFARTIFRHIKTTTYFMDFTESKLVKTRSFTNQHFNRIC